MARPPKTQIQDAIDAAEEELRDKGIDNAPPHVLNLAGFGHVAREIRQAIEELAEGLKAGRNGNGRRNGRNGKAIDATKKYGLPAGLMGVGAAILKIVETLG